MSATTGRPLSLRLSLLLSVAVISVLLVTGLAVNRLVSQPLEEEQSAAQRDRLTVVAAALAEADWTTPRGRIATRLVLRRIATSVRGRASLLDASGQIVFSEGQLPPAVETDQVTESVGDRGSLVVDLPRPARSFLRVFNLTLLGAGLLAVVVLIAVAAFVSDRLTRPLRDVAAAAHRLGAGDLTARATGGADRESSELADAFNTMAERLQRSEMLRRRAASDMAHDLATPATVLESQLQAMVDGVVPADVTQLDHARAAASALSGVVVQLRELVDAESALLSHRPSRVGVAELLAGLAREMEPLFRERGLTLRVDPGPPALGVVADQIQAARSLRNVLTNAAQHSPRGGEVRMTVEERTSECVIRVSDQGPGIDVADRPHLFERFYRADQVRGAGEPRSGSGIGLTIARELLTANGGSIDVERTGPDGTTFAVTLPRAS